MSLKHLHSNLIAVRISLIYLFFGALWILFSDQAAESLVESAPDSAIFVHLQTLKGWFYVAVTAGLLYILIARHMRTIRKSQREKEIHEERNRSLIEHAPLAVCILDLSAVRNLVSREYANGQVDLADRWSESPQELRNMILRARVYHVNPAMIGLLGAKDLHSIQGVLPTVLPREACAEIGRVVRECYEGQCQRIWEVPMRTLDGTELTVLLSVSFPPKREKDWSEVHIMMLDITSLKQMTAELSRSRRQLVEAQRVGKSGSWEWDIVSGKISWSDELFSIYGIDPGTIEIETDTFLKYVHPEDLRAMEEHYQQVIQHKASAPSCHRIIRSNGEIRHLESACETCFDEHGDARLVIGFVQDVTERVQAEEERKKLESQLRHAQKLESLGALAGGIAHDFNNILTPLYGYTELVMSELDPKSRTHEDLSHVMNAAKRGKELVQQILAFSSQIEHERKPVLVHHIVNEAIKLLRATIPPTIQIRKNFNAQIDAVIGNPVQIHQVVMNLCVNAHHAMRGIEGSITLSIDTVSLDNAEIIEVRHLSPGKYVRLDVTDTGIGMDEATRNRVFEPFFTTKPAGEGTGLGLSVSRQIVASHGGTITVQSSPGEGATFSVFLPLSHIGTTEAEAQIAAPQQGSGKILFVDDELEIVEMARQMLTRLGYDVEPATSYDQALAMIADGKKFDLIITDQTMAGKSGIELTMELRSLGNQTPVILLTGDGIGLSDEVIRRSGVNAFQTKPFSVFDLSQKMVQVMRQAHTHTEPRTVESL